MPQFRTGNIWTVYATADLFLITTNATLKQNGALVMGRGIARQARNSFPGLDKVLGQEIEKLCGSQGRYGLLVSPRWPTARLGVFQVKRHYHRPASLDLIRYSTAALCTWCEAQPQSGVHLNFPGVGNGRLPREVVLPIVAQLPEQVTIWEYPSPDKETVL
jgi:hypothetical protein